MARRRRSRVSPYRTQATQEAQLRYAPQQQTLADLLTSAGQQRDAAVQGSLAAALGIGTAAKQGQVTAAQDYGGAALQQQGSQNFTRDQLAKLGPVADLVRGGAESEGQAARQRLQTMALGAMDELRNRQGRAAESADYAIQRALQQYGGDAGKVQQQLQNVAGQQGAFAAQRESQLSEDAAKRDVTLRGQTLSHRDRQAATAESGAQRSADRALRAAGLTETTRHHQAQEAGKGKPGAKLTQGQRKAIGQIAQARDIISDGLKHGVSAAQLKAAFVNGTPSTSEHVVTDRQSKKLVVVAPAKKGIPQLPAEVVQAGFELATQKKIGAGTRQRVKSNQGFDPAHHGYPVMSGSETRATRSRGPYRPPPRAVTGTVKAN